MIPCHALMGDDWDHRAIRDPLTGDADTADTEKQLMMMMVPLQLA